jgi:alpha,alpha-trehalase
MDDYFDQWSRWRAECARVLYGNLPDWTVQARLTHRYTSPAKEKGKYLPQWLWDSCFHAIAYRWFDAEMAWEELLALFEHQVEDGDDAGMVPHMGHLAIVNDVAAQNLFRQPQRSTITQPPLIAIAAARAQERVPNTDNLERIYTGLTAHHDWLDRRRDPDDDGLAAIIHPWEMGWDAAQRWDAILGVKDGSLDEMRRLSSIRQRLMRVIAAHHGNAAELAEVEGGFYVEPADFNAIRAADLQSMAVIADILKKPATEIDRWGQRAERVRHAIREKMLDRETLIATDLVGLDEQKNYIDSAVRFMLLLGQCVTPEEAIRLKDTLQSGGYDTPFRVSTMPTDHPTFDGDQYWRGNVWLAVNWLIYTGLRQYGLWDAATALAQNSLDLINQHGFQEFFNPITGAGGVALDVPCPQNQSWSTIVLDMLATEMLQQGRKPLP